MSMNGLGSLGAETTSPVLGTDPWDLVLDGTRAKESPVMVESGEKGVVDPEKEAQIRLVDFFFCDGFVDSGGRFDPHHPFISFSNVFRIILALQETLRSKAPPSLSPLSAQPQILTFCPFSSRLNPTSLQSQIRP